MSDGRDIYNEPDTCAVLRTDDVYQSGGDDSTSYSEQLLSIIANFQNSGIPEGTNAQSMVGKSKQGEVALQLFAVVDRESQVIEHVGFKARGNLAMTACASVVCTLIEGRTTDEALCVQAADILEVVGEIPWTKSMALTFAVEAIRALVGDFIARGGASLDQLDAALPCDESGINCLLCEHCSLRDTRMDLRLAKMLEERENEQ